MPPSSTDDRPNVLFVSSDQHGYRYTGYEGHEHVRTPNMDRIADRGAVFRNAYCASPVCTPARASMMTGVYAHDVNSFCNATVWDGTEPTWGARMREVGYDTWATGKLELDPEHDTGFEEVNTTNHHAANPDVTSLFRRPVGYRVAFRAHVDGRTRENRHADAETAETAEALIRDRADSSVPWAGHVGFTQPHPEFACLEEYFEEYYPAKTDVPNYPSDHLEEQHVAFREHRRFNQVDQPIPDERIRRARAAYYGMITELDEYVGRLRDALEETGQVENTVVIYTSDHGEMLGEHGLWFKCNLYEDAVHVPLIIEGPGIPSTSVSTPVSHVDLVKTLLDRTGAATPDHLRGHSLDPLVEGREGAHPGYAFSESHGMGNCTGSFTIRRGDWKYVHFTWYDDLLFDLAADPGEFENRIDDPDAQDVLADLRGRLRAEVDPEVVTERAFATQEGMLEDMAAERTEDELYRALAGRLGSGQARALARRYTRE